MNLGNQHVGEEQTLSLQDLYNQDGTSYTAFQLTLNPVFNPLSPTSK